MRLLKPTAALSALLACSALAAAAAPGAQTQPDPTPAQSAAQTGLATATIAARIVPREYRLDGIVEAINSSTVSAQTQGQVKEIAFDVDDYVEQGAVLVRLKDTEQRARLAQATADQKSAAAQLKQAREDHARVKGLAEKQNVSASAVDKSTADLAAAQSALDAANARLDQAQEQLKYTEIRAPYAGIVTARKVAVGEMASPGQALISGISLDELRVAVDVPQSLIAAVRGGAEARVYRPDGTVIETKAITIFPYADPGSNTFKVRVDLPAAPPGPIPLFPGMFVKAGFMVGEKAELAVPKECVVFRSEVTGVYVVGVGGEVNLRQVRLGRDLGDAYVVLAGLTAGERVALNPIAAGVVRKNQDAARTAAGSHHD
ncbi:efflux RND transporter periplasmic adaptor subunit [uncultured Thiodictyon sp.]|uniref:efflux RND transporter periplasmic adaptor subunit n=1 Tax=uncultured Thiodictyon sp. TaxID=1846217 RepID=UPI0025E0BE53|nr:efflux RND transporter periplasmic adaptor subunit [uncultured Thiodictyon sp.]